MAQPWHHWSREKIAVFSTVGGAATIALLITASNRGLPNLLQFLLALIAFVIGTAGVGICISAAYALERRNAADDEDDKGRL